MIVALILLCLFFCPHPVLASTSSVVIVNQVRGSECCDVGSLDNLSTQLVATLNLHEPTTYALRYDALQDPKLVALLKNQMHNSPELIRPGAFLEITPALAQAAHVLYSAEPRDWYKTSNVYPPGYSPADRLALIDAYMQSYHAIFGSYPELTAGWFVDTYTLNYLHDHYGVLVHELTREQWGTDSYTLSGGPLHYPYISSANWDFMPGEDGITIIRQTITDPLRNYGDESSSYTSQPNDYRHSHDFTYFQNLLDNALHQPADQPGFAVLGLENSMSSDYEQEYIRGLNYLASNEPDAKYPSPSQIVTLARDAMPVSVYAGEDTYWVTTPHYQLRLLQSGRHLMITDLRIYDATLPDPYLSSQVRNNGFYLAPYLLDGSRFFEFKQPWYLRLWHPLYNEGYGTKNDLDTLPSHLSLPDMSSAAGEPSLTHTGSTYVLSYHANTGHVVALAFAADQLVTTGIAPRDLKYIDKSGGKLPVHATVSATKYELSWGSGSDTILSLRGICQGDSCSFAPSIDPHKFVQAQHDQPFLLLPTTTTNRDTAGTLIYPSLNYLIFGRSPARVVVLPRTSLGTPVSLATPVTFESGSLTLVSDPVALQSQETQFYDFTAPQVGKYQLKVTVPGFPTQTFQFVFAPNCRDDLKTCFLHPSHLYPYLKAVITAKLRK